MSTHTHTICVLESDGGMYTVCEGIQKYVGLNLVRNDHFARKSVLLQGNIPIQRQQQLQ